MRLVTILVVVVAAMSPEVQLPGDRPAPNPRSTRSVVMARNGVIATSQPLASAAGLRVLQQGGNAIDAAVTAAAVLSVVEPTMNGVGGDLFAIVYDAKTRTIRGLNASGRAPAAATIEEFRRRSLDDIPYRGVLSVSVPGVVDGWNELLTKHGTLTLARALEPAIGYARDGFAVSEIIAEQWKAAEKTLGRRIRRRRRRSCPADARRPPARCSAILSSRQRSSRSRAAAATRSIADRLRRLSRRDMKRRNGLLDRGATWPRIAPTGSTPLSTTYRGYEVLELPPNTQGVVALEMLNILEGFDVKALGHNSAAYLHLLVEAKQIAFADRGAWLADLGSVPPDVLEAAALEGIRRRATPGDRSRARGRATTSRWRSADPRRGADGPPPPPKATRSISPPPTAHGNVVSLIQSILREFRIGHRRRRHRHRAAQPRQPFSLRAGHPNVLAPGKRPFHTLVPAMVLKDGGPGCRSASWAATCSRRDTCRSC